MRIEVTLTVEKDGGVGVALASLLTGENQPNQHAEVWALLNAFGRHVQKGDVVRVSLERIPVQTSGTEDTPPPVSPKDQASLVMAAWNTMASEFGRPSIITIQGSREKNLRIRLREPDGYAKLIEAIKRVGNSTFLRGDGKWNGATFDWILKPMNLQKILEGNYDDTGRGGSVDNTGTRFTGPITALDDDEREILDIENEGLEF